MKLIVQIPCFNEAETLPQTLADIPRTIDGIDRVEVLVIDDGSTDGTVAVARACGADHVISHPVNRGLAATFRTGLDACLRLRADIIVNTDGDNQYAGADIPHLIAPILAGRADLVVGDRRTRDIAHFSPTKKALQWGGSALVRLISGVRVPDAVSGFRAISREAALNINIVSSFSYTIEMLIQAGSKRFAVASVPVRVQRVERQSRLFRNIPQFLARSGTTMGRMFAMYRPLRLFSLIGLSLLLIGTVPIVRFLVFFAMGEGEGKVQSLLLGGVFVTLGFISLLIGVAADLINFNRQLLEMTLERVRRIELALDRLPPPPPEREP